MDHTMWAMVAEATLAESEEEILVAAVELASAVDLVEGSVSMEAEEVDDRKIQGYQFKRVSLLCIEKYDIPCFGDGDKFKHSQNLQDRK